MSTKKPTDTGINRNTKGQFVKGCSGNPEGKNAGIRSKATEIKLTFFKIFEELGGGYKLKQWVEEKPANLKEFYKSILTILPKELDIKSDSALTDMKIVLLNNAAPIKRIDSKPNRVYNNTLKGQPSLDAINDELDKSKESNEPIEE